MSSKTGRFYGVGVGPGDPELITLKAKRVLSKVPVIFVPRKGNESASHARSIISDLLTAGQRVIELNFPMVSDRKRLAEHWQLAADAIWECLEHGEDCAFVNLGDPLLYGTLIPLLETLRRGHPEVEVECIPGVSSVNAAAAEALLPLASGNESVAIVSAGDETLMRQALASFDTVVFMKLHSSFDRLLDVLEELDLVKSSVLVENCTTPDERVVRDIGTLRGERLDYFSLLIVRR